MKLGKYLVLIICLILFFGYGCSDETEPVDLSKLEREYFPLKFGNYIEYQVDSVIYNFQSSSIDSFSSIIREEIVESFLDVNNDTVYRIERKFKRNVSDEWTIIDEWAASRTQIQGTRTEENLRFIKIVFPPDVGSQWDGNVHIPNNIEINIGGEFIQVYKNWDYRITEYITEEQIGMHVFDEVIHIQQADDENALELRYSQEKYAKGIGLVYKEMMILDTQCISDCEGLAWEVKAEKGFILRQTVLDYN